MLIRTRLRTSRAEPARRWPRGSANSDLDLGERRCRVCTHHEAGHVILARVHGMAIDGVRVEPVACAHFSRGQLCLNTAGAIAYAATLYAGGIAGKRAAPFADVGDENDMKILRGMLATALPAVTRRERARVRYVAAMRARGLVAKHWPAIVELAQRLGREGSIMWGRGGPPGQNAGKRRCVRPVPLV